MLNKTKANLFLLLLGFLVANCVDSPVDPTLLQRGISGITYTDESGSLIGAVDHEDWLNAPFEMTPAFPNPTRDTVQFRFFFDTAGINGIIYNAIATVSLIDEQEQTLGIFHVSIKPSQTKSIIIPLSDYSDGMYRIIYGSTAGLNHGDIWKTSAAEEIRRNLQKP